MALCGMKAMSRQRSARRSPGDSLTMSRPAKLISPPAMRAVLAMTPMSARPSVVLPQPDSPTMAVMEPSGTEKLAPSTARNSPLGVRNST